MNTNDLQSLLHEQADHLTDEGTQARLTAVHRRIGAARRRRTAGVAALAVAVIATAGGVVFRPDATNTSPDVVDGIDGPLFRERIAGRELLRSVVSETGESEISFTVAPGTNRYHLSDVCLGPDDYFMHVEINGKPSIGSSCHPSHNDPGASGGTTNLPNDGSPLRITAYVTKGANGPRVTDLPGVTLAAAVYAIPEPIGEAAGHPVYPLIDHGGRDYQVGHYAESAAGQRYYRSQEKDVDGPVLVTVMTSGDARSPGRARMFIDGEEVDAVLGGMGFTTSFLVEDPDDTVTVEVRLSRGAPEDTRIAVVWSTPVG